MAYDPEKTAALKEILSQLVTLPSDVQRAPLFSDAMDLVQRGADPDVIYEIPPSCKTWIGDGLVTLFWLLVANTQEEQDIAYMDELASGHSHSIEINHGNDGAALPSAIVEKKTEKIRWLVEHGADFRYSRLPIVTHAISSEDLDTVIYLVAHGALEGYQHSWPQWKAQGKIKSFMNSGIFSFISYSCRYSYSVAREYALINILKNKMSSLRQSVEMNDAEKSNEDNHCSPFFDALEALTDELENYLDQPEVQQALINDKTKHPRRAYQSNTVAIITQEMTKMLESIIDYTKDYTSFPLDRKEHHKKLLLENILTCKKKCEATVGWRKFERILAIVFFTAIAIALSGGIGLVVAGSVAIATAAALSCGVAAASISGITLFNKSYRERERLVNRAEEVTVAAKDFSLVMMRR